MAKKEHFLIQHPVLPTVLVSSGLGFLGASLCKALLDRHCFVYCLDANTGIKKERLSALNKEKNFQFLAVNPKDPLSAINNLDFDYIFHLGSADGLSWGTAGLLNLAHKQKAKILLLSSLYEHPSRKYNEALAGKYFANLDLNIRTVRLAETYGPGMVFSPTTEVGGYFYNLIKNKPIQIGGDGSQIFTPLYILDALNGLLKAMFGQGTRGKVFWLTNTGQFNSLEFCQKLSSLSGRNLGIEFTANPRTLPVLPLKAIKESQVQLHWQPRADLIKSLKPTIVWFRKNQLFPKLKLKKGKKKFRFISILLFLGLVFLLLLTPFIPLVYYYRNAARESLELKEALLTGDYSLLEEQSLATQQWLIKGKNYLIKIELLTNFFHLGKIADQVNSFFDLGMVLIKVSNLAGQTSKQLNLLLAMIVQGKPGDFYQQTTILNEDLSQLEQELGTLELANQSAANDSGQEQLSLVKKKTALVKELVKILPGLLAYEGKANYLIILQNNLELRPTGGVITAFGFLTFEKGRLLDFHLEPSESANQFLKGEVEKPPILKRYLGDQSWTLKDSNWEVNFPASASRAEWFLMNAFAKRIDGTIAFDLYFLKEILAVFPEKKISLENQNLTSSNLLEKISQAQAQNTEQKDLALLVANKYFTELIDLTPSDWVKFLNLSLEALDKKELLVYLHDSQAYDFFNQRGWDGGLRQLTQKDTYLADYLMLDEANLGGKPINLQVKRQIKQEINIMANGQIQEKVTLNYFNLSNNQYKNYFRVFFPLKTQLLGVNIGDNPTNLAAFDLGKVDDYLEYGKRGVGFLIEVPEARQKVVEIIYQLGESFNPQNTVLGYAYFFQKQPGIGEEFLELTINYPVSFKIIKNVPKMEIAGQQLKLKTTTLKDRLVLVTFGR